MQASHHSLDIDPYAGDMLEFLFDYSPTGIVVLNPTFTILRYNLTWENFCHRNSPETADKLHISANYFEVLPLAQPTFEPLLERALNGETVHKAALCIPTTSTSPFCNILIAPLIQQQQVTSILVAGTDVSQQIETQQALQTALNELRLSHEAVEQLVEDRTRELKTLMTVQQALTSSLNQNEVLHVIAREARRLTNTQIGGVFLPQGDNLLLAALSCEYPINIDVGYSISLTDSITGTAFCTGQTQLVTNISGDSLVDPNAISMAHLRSILSIPLVSGARTIGVLSVGNKVEGELGAEDQNVLNMMVPSAVIALENVRIYEQASEIAVAEERGRLARELHDSVTQTLFSASLTAEVLPLVWARDVDEGMLRLEKLRELTRGALAEMRTLLLELRPSTLVETPLDNLLHQLVEGIVSRTRIDIDVVVEVQKEFLPDMKVALYRIAQEALNNVAKHSRAQNASVSLTQRGHLVQLTIMDNGIGFDKTINPTNHLGLRIMEERASAIGASLSIESVLGQGTQINVRLEQEQ